MHLAGFKSETFRLVCDTAIIQFNNDNTQKYHKKEIVRWRSCRIEMSKYRNEIQRIDQTETTNYCSGDTFIFILENVTCSMILSVNSPTQLIKKINQ